MLSPDVFHSDGKQSEKYVVGEFPVVLEADHFQETRETMFLIINNKNLHKIGTIMSTTCNIQGRCFVGNESTRMEPSTTRLSRMARITYYPFTIFSFPNTWLSGPTGSY